MRYIFILIPLILNGCLALSFGSDTTEIKDCFNLDKCKKIYTQGSNPKRLICELK